jgi:uncharacterized protein
MKWNREHQSPDVIDRRGQRVDREGGAGAGGLLRVLLPVVASKFGIVGVLMLVVGVGVLQQFGDVVAPPEVRTAHRPVEGMGDVHASDERSRFIGFVLDDVQDHFQKKFSEMGKRYQRAKLVLFTDRTSTGCGYGDAATGPFYCPLDQNIYIDLGFFRELSARLGAPGDFAQAYVIAHEVGHHVQKLLGVSESVGQRERVGAESGGVRLELQADCLAGTWAHSTEQRELLEAGDLEESLGAAAAIGDDRLQRQAGGAVRPERFTHGTSKQRARWFRTGLESGELARCDTFATRDL